MLDTKPLLFRSGTQFPPLTRQALDILQVNLGYLCNLSCTHCHVNAGPSRTELMTADVIDTVLDVVASQNVRTLDLTGGAPEMNPEFRRLVSEARRLGVSVIDRCNLTILNQPGYESLAEFLAAEKVHVVASLPCYSEANVDGQRGKGVFESSLEGLHKLNRLGYGVSQSGLTLDLVYNPGGAFLPPPQTSLEQDYKRQLAEKGIYFNNLLTLTNMPISRFGSMLISKGEFESYMTLLKDNFSASNLASVMCLNTISVDWQGYLYDCDFNQMLAEPVVDLSQSDSRYHLRDLLKDSLAGHPIKIGDHCYGCTAGQGSSCGGALE